MVGRQPVQLAGSLNSRNRRRGMGHSRGILRECGSGPYLALSLGKHGILECSGQLWRRCRARENLGFLGAEDLLDSAIRHDMFLVLFLGFLSRWVRIAPQQKERGCHSGFHEPT